MKIYEKQLRGMCHKGFTGQYPRSFEGLLPAGVLAKPNRSWGQNLTTAADAAAATIITTEFNFQRHAMAARVTTCAPKSCFILKQATALEEFLLQAFHANPGALKCSCKKWQNSAAGIFGNISSLAKTCTHLV